MPELLRQGKVFVAETPLFEIVIGKDKSRFAYTVEEKNKILEELKEQGIKVIKINRSKGLGENNPDMLWETTMCPETRHLVPLTIDTNEVNVRNVTQMLFGSDINAERSKVIFEVFKDGLLDIETAKETETVDLELKAEVV